ncbi:MAG: C25 family peptidase propeptide domain-containing protein, partial [bacterium]
MKLGKILFSLCLIVLGFSTALAAYTPLRGDLQDERVQIDVLHRTADQVQIEVRLPGIDLLTGELQGRRWDRVEIPGGGYELELGAPEVPHFTRLISIPNGSGVRAEMEILEESTFQNVDLMPAQGLDPVDFAQKLQAVNFDATVYSRDAFYPEN